MPKLGWVSTVCWGSLVKNGNKTGSSREVEWCDKWWQTAFPTAYFSFYVFLVSWPEREPVVLKEHLELRIRINCAQRFGIMFLGGGGNRGSCLKSKLKVVVGSFPSFV